MQNAEENFYVEMPFLMLAKASLEQSNAGCDSQRLPSNMFIKVAFVTLVMSHGPLPGLQNLVALKPHKHAHRKQICQICQAHEK